MTTTAYDLFHCTTGRKSSVLRFHTVEAAKDHARSMFGEFIACEPDGDNLDIFTNRGEILAIEPATE
jgi:hypothetical protein